MLIVFLLLYTLMLGLSLCKLVSLLPDAIQNYCLLLANYLEVDAQVFYLV